mmetsp:Transcript_47060/g.102342  ORF Transcript_47060/g.102342 Transcript_47060/m.102342 type:complete len:104 (-) Transcript_47060:29-340(-)
MRAASPASILRCRQRHSKNDAISKVIIPTVPPTEATKTGPRFVSLGPNEVEAGRGDVVGIGAGVGAGVGTGVGTGAGAGAGAGPDAGGGFPLPSLQSSQVESQ